MRDRIAIIGAGMGGLASAAMLAARGHDVTVIEKEEWVGGKARTVEVDGKAIEAGPTVFTMRDVFDQIFHTCGARLDDYIDVRCAEVIARHAWADGGTLDLFADPVRSEEAIGDFAGVDAAAGYRAFRQEARRIYEVLDEPFLRGDSASTPLPMMWRMGLHRIGDAMAMRPFDNLWKALGEHFADPRLQQLYGRYATYCGSDPFQAPATLMLIAHTEARGVWLIDGGISALANALRQLAESKGVRFMAGSHAAQILIESRRVSGVRLTNGDTVPADIVISNADPAALSDGKFGEHAAQSVRAMPKSKRSLSALVWFAHAETSGFDLSHHNVFFSPDYAREFADIAGGRPPSDPTVYLCAQDRSASERAAGNPRPSSRERIQIIVNAPANGDTHHYSAEEIETCTLAMRSSLRRCGLALEEQMPHQLATPETWEGLFPATGGALYGRASHGWAASFQRQGPKTRIPGLYCAGGATHPAAGVPMAALSGLLAARTIERDLASMRRFHRAATPGGISMRSAKTGSTG
ncbi:1-hydroxycarotenoid 3,4-desaturase CrtD [Erythrobacter rubeus]|uniref:Phytoene desaturase n=1 Tax=Erythrobacter rubeus TaxID=2760803 RepID=A0ABR8KSE3_9SPHN|nr:1-hydroxycarotenoid 3,4-desaturase CrtD [Erythrobacter rubeus]MBD2841121.1 phytoene desaturase [Erythrobacter rubeus]